MDKIKSIRIIQGYFSVCFNENVNVIYDVTEGVYKIGNDEYKLEDDKFMYIIFPIKDNFLQWCWDTNLEAEFVEAEFVLNDFTSCLEEILKFHFKYNLQCLKEMTTFGVFEDDYNNSSEI